MFKPIVRYKIRAKPELQKPPIKKKIWLLIVSAGLATLLAGMAMACAQIPAASSLSVEPSVKSTHVQPPTIDNHSSEQQLQIIDELDVKNWSTVKTFTGYGNETTSIFHISGEKWRIIWTTDNPYPEYAVFELFIYREGESTTPIRIFSDSSSTTDITSSINEGGNDYHIKIFAANSIKWTIKVEEYISKASTFPIQITRIYYKGSVQKDYSDETIIVEADEYVEIKNLGEVTQQINGWTLKNISRGSPLFTFPSYLPCQCDDDYESCIEECVPLRPCVLKPHHSIRVYTGEVHFKSGGFCFYYPPGNIWNNNEPDIAVLYNSKREEVSRRSYNILQTSTISN